MSERNRSGANIDRDMAEVLHSRVIGTPSFVLGRTTPCDTLEEQRILGAQRDIVLEMQIKALVGG